MSGSAPPTHSRPVEDERWIVRHFAIVLYGWFFFGMLLCGLLAPPDRVAALGSSLITEGWHLSLLACVLVSPVLAVYGYKLRAPSD